MTKTKHVQNVDKMYHTSLDGGACAQKVKTKRKSNKMYSDRIASFASIVNHAEMIRHMDGKHGYVIVCGSIRVMKSMRDCFRGLVGGYGGYTFEFDRSLDNRGYFVTDSLTRYRIEKL